MPTNCCVPLCTKKDKRDKETGEKISFFRFPEEENLKKQWIHAIRRDVGPNFSINEGTRVCSRHFRGEDLQRSLTGKVRTEQELCRVNSHESEVRLANERHRHLASRL